MCHSFHHSLWYQNLYFLTLQRVWLLEADKSFFENKKGYKYFWLLPEKSIDESICDELCGEKFLSLKSWTFCDVLQVNRANITVKYDCKNLLLKVLLEMDSGPRTFSSGPRTVTTGTLP